MEPENPLDSTEFEVAQMTHEHIKSEKDEVSEKDRHQIKVEDDLDRKGFEDTQIYHASIKDEYGQCVGTYAGHIVSDRIYNTCDTKANFDNSYMRFEEASESVLNMQDVKIELQNDVEIGSLSESSDKQLAIKNEIDEQTFSNLNTEIVLNSTAKWTKCEAVEELKIENDLNIETYGITEITEEYIIKNDDDHILKHPGGEGRHQLNVCIHCNVTFRGKRSLDDHIIKKHPEHIASVSNKIYECRYCIYKTTITSNLSTHMRKHPEAEDVSEPKTCIYCKRTFKHKPNLNDHIIKKHPEYIAEVSSKIHSCKHCTYRTTIKKSLVQHMLKHPEAESDYELKKCVHCNVKFKRKANLDDHIIKKHPKYIASVSSKIHECKYCVFKTAIKGLLVDHMWQHPRAEGGCERKLCVHCTATFKYKTNLDDHIIEKHPEYIALVSSKIHECKYCAFKTTIKDRLARHLGKHPGAEGGYQLKTCIHCDAIFKDRISLDDHITKKHTEYIASVLSKIHECKYCVFKTTSSTSLSRHMRKHPEAESGCELKMCIHCNTTFACKKNLHDHIIKKHPNFIAEVSSKIHACAHCAFRTTVKKSLVQHMLKHPAAEGDYKPNKCVHCNGAFRLKTTLDNHIIKKHPEYITLVSSKIYECRHCPFKTTTSDHLSKHMVNHPGAGGYELKTCIHCNLKFKRKINLDGHIIRKHPEHIASVSSKFHECIYCTYKTIAKNKLAGHMLKHSDAERTKMDQI
ncbi:unnamed protein product [Acanthoscelides obtectus]|uniref:C2H2-type domain-containing protein n=1 Tax=Acanthoscelides obtectus TaxID=200917 RepID=A0A9P0PCZ4_ACAOB|nr:unnamed protein product [Acanthoscelides obtectus]CAK1664815.1 Zinc finger X-chromosomal protein [Acanthoscelides obtectus]